MGKVGLMKHAKRTPSTVQGLAWGQGHPPPPRGGGPAQQPATPSLLSSPQNLPSTIMRRLDGGTLRPLFNSEPRAQTRPRGAKSATSVSGRGWRGASCPAAAPPRRARAPLPPPSPSQHPCAPPREIVCLREPSNCCATAFVSLFEGLFLERGFSY